MKKKQIYLIMIIVIAITVIPSVYAFWKTGAFDLVNKVLGPLFWVGCLLFIIVLIAGTFWLIRYVKRGIKPKTLANGLPATATVIRSYQSHMKVTMGGVQEMFQLIIEVTVQNNQGESWPAKMEEFVPITQVGIFQPGTSFKVLYDPNNRSKIVFDQSTSTPNAANWAGQPGQPSANAPIEIPGLGVITAEMAKDAAAHQPHEIVDKMKANAATLNSLNSTGITATAKALSRRTVLENYMAGIDAVELSFKVDNTAIQAEQVIITPKSSLHKTEVGKTIYVRYDPNNPQTVVICGLDKPDSTMSVQ